MSELQIKPLHEIIERLFSKTLMACEKAGAISSLDILKIKELMQKEGLDPDQIESQCAEEIKCLCTYEYEEVVSGSNRLSGKGYSSQKIEEHMKVFLREKLKKFATIISLKKENLKPKSLKKSFEETQREIYLEKK
jgi:hypothetical protein